MPFTKPVPEIIRERSSCRIYLSKCLETSLREQLEQSLWEKPEAPFPGKGRFKLIDTFDPAATTKIGTYGTITYAQHFMVGAIKRGDKDLENFGFLMEYFILSATDLGLGTCWLGGSFSRGGFGARIAAQADECVAAVTPVGYKAQTRGVVDQLLKWSAKSKQRKPWEQLFFQADFDHSLSPSAAGAYTEVLEMVRLAPSASNRQPWRIIQAQEPGTYHLYLQRSQGYGQVSKLLLQTEDLQRIDMGIAMCHFSLTAQALKLKGRWQSKDPGLAPLPERTEYSATWENE